MRPLLLPLQVFFESSTTATSTTLIMQSRHAAFALLRRLALQDFVETPRSLPKWSRPAARPFRYIAPRPFYHSAQHFNNEQLSQTPPQEPAQEPVQEPTGGKPRATTHEARTTARPKKSSYIPKSPIPFEKQAYEMTFTCKPCSTRSTHRVSKQGYHFGSVLITCPECKNRHIISDHLGVSCTYRIIIEEMIMGS